MGVEVGNEVRRWELEELSLPCSSASLLSSCSTSREFMVPTKTEVHLEKENEGLFLVKDRFGLHGLQGKSRLCQNKREGE